MTGEGSPRASHVIDTSFPSSTVTSPLLLESSMVGGTRGEKTMIKVCIQKHGEVGVVLMSRMIENGKYESTKKTGKRGQTEKKGTINRKRGQNANRRD